MSIEGTGLSRAMLEIHAVEMDQATRCPDWRSSARVERHILLRRNGNLAIHWLGCHLERIGQRLREYALPRIQPLETKATRLPNGSCE
jgi:hypothetical protein